MRIGMLTLPPNSNYGGILQAYALQTVLERMGNDVVILDSAHKPVKRTARQCARLPLTLAKRMAWKCLHPTRGVPLRLGSFLKSIEKERRVNTDRFISMYLHKTAEKSYYDLRREDFDAIVVGSDQVWRPLYFMWTGAVEDAYLAFAEDWNIKRVAYAASFGTDKWEYTERQTVRCGQLLKKFDAVSLREASAVGIVKSHFGVDAVHVLDPTMLLRKEDYSRLVERAEQDGTLERMTDEGAFLLTYILDETTAKSEIVTAVAAAKGLKVVKGKCEEFNIRTYSRKNGISKYIQPPVESWLRNFRDCQYVVTDSFHGCVFSIMNEKQFVVIGNKERGMARFTSLLAMFGLESRMVAAGMDYQSALLTPIDYAAVNRRLAALRVRSNAFLKSSL